MNQKPRFATFLLMLTMFCTGACGLVAEYVLGTVSTYILGNSIEQMSMTIAIMMLMMGVGGVLQKYLRSDQYLVETFVVLEIILALMVGFAPIALHASFGLMEHHFRLVQYFFIGTIGLLIGFEIPMVLRINERYSPTLRENLAHVLSVDYIGAFLGAVVWSYYLLKRFPLTEISFILAGVNFTVALITAVYFMSLGRVKKKLAIVSASALTVCCLVFGYTSNRKWSIYLEQRLYDNPIVFAETTPYQRLVVTHGKKLDEYRLYINGNLQFSSLDEAIYHEHLVHPAMSVAPRRANVLVLGGGDGLALREVLKYPDVEHVMLVDLDPDMVRLCSTDPILRKLNANAFADARVTAKIPSGITPVGHRTLMQNREDEVVPGRKSKMRIGQVTVVTVDADKFLSSVGEFWDVILVDFPDPNAVELAKLYSKEFYLKLDSRLSQTGVVAVQATSPYHAKEAFLCINRTMSSAGFKTVPYHDNVPSFGDWGWILACKSSAAPRMDIASRIEKVTFEVPTAYLDERVFARARVFGKGWLDSKHDDLNTLMHPVLLSRYVDEGWQVD